MPRTITLLAIFAFLVDFAVTLDSEMQQLEEVIKEFDDDYKQGNMSKLSSDFKGALKKYGDGQNQKPTIVQEFLKKMEDNGDLQTMKKLETEWNNFKAVLGKHYDQSENSLRMAVFESNELFTEKMNKEFEKGLTTYKTGMNELADLTASEFRMINGFRLPNHTFRVRSKTYQFEKNRRLPKSVDWRKKGFVTPIKNQGQCGSCYAFATAAALESYHKMKSRKLINLSPQNIVDCTTGYGNYGCDGGFMPLTFKYAMKYGIAKESNYPYVGVLQRCQWKQQIAVARDKGYMEVESGNELALQRAVAKYGPVTVGIPGYHHTFQFYKSGIYARPGCNNPDHAVLVVGYGTHRTYGDYWIIKNSWGTSWGDGGYGYIARNKGNMCSIASMASFPI
ncbi:Papain cysteine protease family protein [Acanthocheilonema viteae]